VNEIHAATRPTASCFLDSTLGKYTYFTQCSDNPTLYVPLIVYFVLLLGTCCFLAYKCRKAPEGFNEASSLLIACSLMFVYGCFIIDVQFVVASNPVASSLLRSFGNIDMSRYVFVYICWFLCLDSPLLLPYTYIRYSAG
jgi:hypothetical protein